MSALAVSLVVPSLAFAQNSNVNSATSIQTSISENSTEARVNPQWKTKVARKTLEQLLDTISNKRNIEKVTSALRELPKGDKLAGYFEDSISYIKKNLKDLLEWEEVFENNVRDVIAGAIYDAGAPLSVARSIAWVVVEVLL
ncbi:hypothetical protein EEL30_02565 [Brevibacillus laterosporus]|uniref:Uncharacterized protein n=1 Tax=Brevibacillus laterosporus TaxID=1465 RepID=A0A518V2X9_BRELA|nr:hypothetical protein EEL30_02565 [Brevibacillus laterosporus]